MLPAVAGIAGYYDQATRFQQHGNFFLRFDMREFHDAGRAETEGGDGIGEAWHTVDMRRDALAGLVFVR